MNLQIRRGLVLTGVALSLAVGLASIRVAAALTADAAPPPAPPVSMASLQAQLTAEQAGSVALQQQLDEVDSLTAQLSDAIGVTSSDVSTDGLNAKQLRARLVAAQKKLATASRLLEQARAKLAAVNSVAPRHAGRGTGRGADARGTPEDARAEEDAGARRLMAVEPPPAWARPAQAPPVSQPLALTPPPAAVPVPPPGATRRPPPEIRTMPIRPMPDRAMPAAGSKSGPAKRVETRRPLHIPVIAGISAGLDAGSLFVTSGLQFATDREAIADRQPMADAIAILQQDHEAITAALQAATARYNEAVDGYGGLTSDREALQARLARLGKQVATIEGITITSPSLDWSIADALSPPRSTRPKTSGGTPRSSGAAANPAAVAPAAAPAPAVAQPRAVAPAPLAAPAPPPPVAATTGASGKP